MRNHPRFIPASKLSFHLSFLIACMGSAQVMAAGAGQDAAASEQASTEASKDGHAQTLTAVNVFGTLENKLSVGSKAGQSLRETPKSVTIVTHERIEAQNLTSLSEVLVQTTGVTVGGYSPVDSFYFSRGFQVRTMQFDGGAPAYTGDFGFFYTPDTAAYDHVEMLRGVDGMYSGAGEPGGVINMVRKRPEYHKAVQLDASAGSWNNYRGQLDVTGPLTEDGRLRGRAVGAYADRGYFWDRSTTNKKILYGVLDFDATDTTLLSFGINYENRDEGNYTGYSGHPRYADGRDLHLPRGTTFNPDWAYWDFKNRELFGKVEQKYGDSGLLKLNLTRIQQDSDAKYLNIAGAINPSTMRGTQAYASYNQYSSVQNLADLSASGKFELFGQSHNYTVGTDYALLDGGGQRTHMAQVYDPSNPDPQLGAYVRPLDVFNYNPALYTDPKTHLAFYYPVNEQSQRGLYATVGLQLLEPLRLTLGGRYGSYRYDSVMNNFNNNTTSTQRYKDSKFIPSAALSYTLSRDWSAYLSYGQNFKVQANMLQGPLPGTPLAPVTGDSLELGVKGEFLGRLNAAAAIYQVKRSGQGVEDPAYPPNYNANDGSACCYMRQADITAKGLDLELSGEIARGWQLFAGYTYVKTKYLHGDDDQLYSTGAWLLGMTPKHLFKAWSTWQLPGQFSRWTLNAGVIAQSKAFMSGSVPVDLNDPGLGYQPFQFTQGGYALWNASVQYALNDNWSLGLYGDNLTDRRYYQAIGDVRRQNVYGTPRSATLTIRGRW